MSGLNTLQKNLRILTDEAEAIRARAARLGIHLEQMADQVSAAIEKQKAKAEGGAE